VNLDRFTLKTQEALERSRAIAEERNHQEIAPEHILLALLEQEDGVAVGILTSNLAAHEIMEAEDLDDAGFRERVDAVLRHHFRPEFLNRLDETILFRRLTEADMTAILDRQLARLEATLAKRNLKLSVTDGAKTLLSKESYDPRFGARPLARTLQRRVQNPLAARLLAGDFADGDVVEVDAAGEGIVLSRG